MHTRMLHEVEGRGTVYKQAGGALLKEEGERRRPSPLFVVWLVDLGAYHDLPSKRARFLQLTRKNGRCWAYIFIFRGRIGSSRELLKRPELLSLPPPYTSPPLSPVFIPPPPLIVPRADKTIEQRGPLRPRVILDKY